MVFSSKILMGVIMGACGIRGGVRFKSYAESVENLKSYKVFQDQAGQQRFNVKQILPYKENILTLYLEGTTTRNQAEALKGVALYVDRLQLKKLSKEEFYYHDLEGLAVRDEQNGLKGYVKKVVHYGVVVTLSVSISDDFSSEILVPFRKEFVREVNLEEGYIVLDTDYMQAFFNLNRQA